MMVGKHHVTFGFARATSLPDPRQLLEGTGKNLRHVKVRDMAGVKSPGLRDLIRAAARLNREGPLDGSKKLKYKTNKRARTLPPATNTRTGADLIAAMQMGRRLGLRLRPTRIYLSARPPIDFSDNER